LSANNFGFKWGNFRLTTTEVFYNQQRRHSALNYLSPAEFERRQQNNEKEAKLALKS